MPKRKLFILWTDDLDKQIIKDELENFTHIINKENKVFGKNIQVLYKGKVIKVYSKKFSFRTFRKLSEKGYFINICSKSERFACFSKKGLNIYQIKGSDERASIYSTILAILTPYLPEDACKKLIGRK